MKGEHFREIDVLKGVLILLVVVGHLIPQFPLCVESNLGRRILCSIYGFHMQAFVLVAGFCSVPLAEKLPLFESGRFLGRRAVRLLIPYLVWGCAYFALRFLVPRLAANPYDMSRCWQFLIGYNPDGALWFLWALFAATAVVTGCRHLFSLGRLLILSAIVAIGALWTQPWFGLPVATNALPLFVFFFTAGLWVRMHYARLQTRICTWPFGCAAVVAWLFATALQPSSPVNPPHWYALGLTSVAGTALMLFVAVRLAKGARTWLSVPWIFLSGYAMEIYILAEPVKVVCRTIFSRLGMPVPVSFITMLVLMLAAPIILSRFVLRGKWLPLLLLGRMPRKDVCK